MCDGSEIEQMNCVCQTHTHTHTHAEIQMHIEKKKGYIIFLFLPPFRTIYMYDWPLSYTHRYLNTRIIVMRIMEIKYYVSMIVCECMNGTILLLLLLDVDVGDRKASV